MRANSIALLMFGFLATSTEAKPTVFFDPVSTSLEITWIGELEAGKGNVTISGATFENIDAQAKAMNPDYTIFKNATNLAQRDTASLNGIKNINCGIFTKVHTPTIEEGIAFLNGLDAWCTLPPGPDLCVRFSCSWNAGIFFCNRSDRMITKPCTEVAEMAQAVVDKCQEFGWPDRNFGPDKKVSGEVFLTDKSSLQVGRSSC